MQTRTEWNRSFPCFAYTLQERELEISNGYPACQQYPLFHFRSKSMTPNDLQNTASEAFDTAAASSHEAADKTLRAASEALSQASARPQCSPCACRRNHRPVDRAVPRNWLATASTRRATPWIVPSAVCAVPVMPPAPMSKTSLLKSIAIAAGVGAATVALIMLLRNRDR